MVAEIIYVISAVLLTGSRKRQEEKGHVRLPNWFSFPFQSKIHLEMDQEVAEGRAECCIVLLLHMIIGLHA